MFLSNFEHFVFHLTVTTLGSILGNGQHSNVHLASASLSLPAEPGAAHTQPAPDRDGHRHQAHDSPHGQAAPALRPGGQA